MTIRSDLKNEIAGASGNDNEQKVGAHVLTLPKLRKVTIRGAQPSARLSEEIRLSEGVSPRARWGLCAGPRDFPRFFGSSDPMLVTLGNCWKRNASLLAKESFEFFFSYKKQHSKVERNLKKSSQKS